MKGSLTGEVSLMRKVGIEGRKMIDLVLNHQNIENLIGIKTIGQFQQ